MQTFYKTKDDKKMVSTMKTSGTFNIGNVTPLDAVALELPYEVLETAQLLFMNQSVIVLWFKLTKLIIILNHILFVITF